MNHCKDCKHWQKTDGYTNHPSPWGECVLGQSRNGYRREPKSLAYARDGERYHAEMMTHPTFGCVMWEGKGKTS